MELNSSLLKIEVTNYPVDENLRTLSAKNVEGNASCSTLAYLSIIFVQISVEIKL